MITDNVQVGNGSYDRLSRQVFAVQHGRRVSPRLSLPEWSFSDSHQEAQSKYSTMDLRSVVCGNADVRQDPENPVKNTVETTGVEPVTSGLQSRRSPN